MLELIKKMTGAYGPSGREEEIRNTITNLIKDQVDGLEVDYLGNLIAFKKGTLANAQKVMLSAHMDEIGFIITHIDEKGFLRFSNVGGHMPHRLINTRVILSSKRQGVIGHEKIDNIKDLTLDKMYIDIGTTSRAESQEYTSIGDIAVFDQPLIQSGDKLISKAMDDRIGCAVLVETINRLSDCVHDTYFVFSTQEELGLRGAKTAAYKINPDFGLAVDVTLTGDTPECKKMEVALGNGVAIKLMDSSLIVSPKVRDFLIEIAEKEKIKYQVEVLDRGGTDAGAINLAREGVLAGCLSIPCRYVHSPSEMIDLNDVENCVQLFIKLLQSNSLEKYQPSKS